MKSSVYKLPDTTLSSQMNQSLAMSGVSQNDYGEFPGALQSCGRFNNCVNSLVWSGSRARTKTKSVIVNAQLW